MVPEVRPSWSIFEEESNTGVQLTAPFLVLFLQRRYGEFDPVNMKNERQDSSSIVSVSNDLLFYFFHSVSTLSLGAKEQEYYEEREA
jgi:hypothetical protein